MKTKISLLLACVLLAMTPLAYADYDISGLSYGELVELVNQAQMAMMQMDEWQEVTVPAGVYRIGVDIPAGRWTIKAPPQVNYITIVIGDELKNANSVKLIRDWVVHGSENILYHEGDATYITIVVEDGQYLEVKHGDAIFTPYQGNSFTFR